MTIITLAKKVKAMREVQKQYFSTRSKKALIQSKELEKEVDQAIAELEHLQLELPGDLDEVILQVNEQIDEAREQMREALHGYSYTTDSGYTRVVPPSPGQHAIWEKRKVLYLKIIEQLCALDRLQRKLNQKEVNHET